MPLQLPPPAPDCAMVYFSAVDCNLNFEIIPQSWSGSEDCNALECLVR